MTDLRVGRMIHLIDENTTICVPDHEIAGVAIDTAKNVLVITLAKLTEIDRALDSIEHGLDNLPDDYVDRVDRGILLRNEVENLRLEVKQMGPAQIERLTLLARRLLEEVFS